MVHDVYTLDHFLELERQVWQALVDGDADADRALLSEDFVGVYPSGFANRDDHVGQFVAAPTVSAYTIDRARVIEVSSDSAMLCYLATFQRPDDSSIHRMYVSSLWCERDGTWVNTFSQDTPAADSD
jgi:hypothetical protein